VQGVVPSGEGGGGDDEAGAEGPLLLPRLRGDAGNSGDVESDECRSNAADAAAAAADGGNPAQRTASLPLTPAARPLAALFLIPEGRPEGTAGRAAAAARGEAARDVDRTAATAADDFAAGADVAAFDVDAAAACCCRGAGSIWTVLWS